MKIRSLLIAGIAAIAVAMPAFAHRVGLPITTIEYNDTTAVWEVVHRMSSHDLEPLFNGQISPSKLYDTPEGIVLIGQYVDTHFEIEGATRLSYVGAEADGDLVWVYYEMDTDGDDLSVDSDLLLDGDGSMALVNVKRGGDVTTLTFTANDGAKPVRLR